MFDDQPGSSVTSFFGGLFGAIFKAVDIVGNIIKVGVDIVDTASDIKQTLHAFDNVNWENGTSVKVALLDVVKDVLDCWKTLEDTVNIIPGFKLALEGFLDANPEFSIAIEGLTVLYNLETGKGKNLMHDISDDMSNLVHGLETADWSRAMAGLGGIIHDIDQAKGILTYTMTEVNHSGPASNSEDSKASQANSQGESAAKASASSASQQTGN